METYIVPPAHLRLGEKVVRRVFVRPAIVVFASLVVLGAFALPFLPSARAETGKPTWQKGDWWAYSLQNISSPSGGTASGTLKMIVAGQANVTVGGVTYPTYDTKDWLNVTQGSLTYSIAGDTWFRVSDLSLVQAAFSFSTSTPSGTASVSITITDAPPHTMTWPLTAGATWSSTTTETTVTTITIPGYPPQTNTVSASVTYQYAVQADAQVSVPKGSFVATPVKQTQAGATSYTMTYSSWDVGNYVKQTTYGGSGSEQSGATLTDYSYAPPSRAGASSAGPVYWPWAALVAAIAVAVVVAVLFWRRRRPTPQPMPPGEPSAMAGLPPQPPPPTPPSEQGPPPGPP